MADCPVEIRLSCINYSNGTKRRNHHIRLTENCVRYETNCPDLGGACNLEKIRRIKGK